MAAKVQVRDNYVGEKKDQLREGYGIYTYENKFFRYEGEWKAGKKHGHGKLVMADGSYYEGQFKDGEIDGHGYRYFALGGNSYSGEFQQGELHGQGVMKYADDSIYEGQWNRNRREGYGVLKGEDDGIYQGMLYRDMRHGEGTQIYSNGDRYDGDWVLNKRQGHGEWRAANGTVYDGQFANDMFNGQGSMQHASGVIYEGLWNNGRPAILASKLVITNEGPIEIIQGTAFTINVECHNQYDVLVPDQGRSLQIMAGFKYQKPLTDDMNTTDKDKEENTAALFDVIEDMEEKPISTPFGYEIVSYPMSDALKPEELYDPEGPSRSATTLSEQTIKEVQVNPSEDAPAPEAKAEGVDIFEKPATEETQADIETVVNSSDDRTDSPTVVTSSDMPEAAPPADDEQSPPPPVGPQRTDQGQCTFDNLVLVAAPPMYRPFALLDAEENVPPPSKSRTGSRRSEEGSARGSRPSTRHSKKDVKIVDHDKFSRPDDHKPVEEKKSDKEKSSDQEPTKSSGDHESEHLVEDKSQSQSEPKLGVSKSKSQKNKDGSVLKKKKSGKKPLELDTQKDDISADTSNNEVQGSDEDMGDDEKDRSMFAEEGEYVIMVADSSSPPFMEFLLQPAFIQVKVSMPKKKKLSSKSKEKGPRWDTSKHIQAASVGAYSAVAEEDIALLEAAQKATGPS